MYWSRPLVSLAMCVVGLHLQGSQGVRRTRTVTSSGSFVAGERDGSARDWTSALGSRKYVGFSLKKAWSFKVWRTCLACGIGGDDDRSKIPSRVEKGKKCTKEKCAAINCKFVSKFVFDTDMYVKNGLIKNSGTTVLTAEDLSFLPGTPTCVPPRGYHKALAEKKKKIKAAPKPPKVLVYDHPTLQKVHATATDAEEQCKGLHPTKASNGKVSKRMSTRHRKDCIACFTTGRVSLKNKGFCFKA